MICCGHRYKSGKVAGGVQRENHPQLQANRVDFDVAFEGQTSWQAQNLSNFCWVEGLVARNEDFNFFYLNFICPANSEFFLCPQ